MKTTEQKRIDGTSYQQFKINLQIFMVNYYRYAINYIEKLNEVTLLESYWDNLTTEQTFYKLKDYIWK
jgi:hypothetical protein